MEWGGRIGSLFEQSVPVVGEEARMETEAPAILPAEAARVARAVPSRRVEFAVGRTCAHRALSRLGLAAHLAREFVIDVGPAREPCWPPGIVGSITHTGGAPGGYCAAVVARARDLLTVGIDAELSGAVGPPLWSHVLTEGERSRLEGQAPPERAALATLLFSAKETFHKAHFPLTRRYLDFLDVEISADLAEGGFQVRLGSHVTGMAQFAGWPGRFSLGDGLILTGIAVRK
jgi:4'-phosphopantetheinyl transferase EntD